MKIKTEKPWQEILQQPILIRQRDSRRGASVLFVLVFLTFGTAIIIGLLNFSLHHQRQLARQLQAEQAIWMVDAGLGRAADRLASDPEYPGESIRFGSPWGRFSAAELTIAVSQDHSRELRQITVTATLLAAEGAESTVRKSIKVSERSK